MIGETEQGLMGEIRRSGMFAAQTKISFRRKQGDCAGVIHHPQIQTGKGRRTAGGRRRGGDSRTSFHNHRADFDQIPLYTRIPGKRLCMNYFMARSALYFYNTTNYIPCIAVKSLFFGLRNGILFASVLFQAAKWWRIDCKIVVLSLQAC